MRGADSGSRQSGPAVAYRASAAVLGRSGYAPGDREIHAVGAAGRALVSQQHRIHPPHQRTGFDRRRASHRFRRQLSGPGAGRRLFGRAGGDADRSAAPAGDHQVQSGAHLDAGERGGHWRRLSVRVRDGGSGRIPICRPHAADVEHVPHDGGVSAGHAVAAALLRSDSFLPGDGG